MARTPAPAPHAARSAADAATTPAAAPVAPAAGDSPAAAVLAALSAEPAGATVAVIAGHAGMSTAAARQALLAHENAGTATRVKGRRPGIADTWTPAAASAPLRDQAPPAVEPSGSAADTGQPTAPAGGTAEGGEAEAGPAQEPNLAVTAEAAGNILAIAPGRRRSREGSRGREPPGCPDRTRRRPGPGHPGTACAEGRRYRPPRPSDPARRAPRPGRGTPAQVPQHGLDPAPGRQRTDPVLRRGRQRPGQARQPRYRRAGLRQAPQLPARPAVPAPARDAAGDPGTSAETAASAA
jgi:hypothetical protein